jgi:hypothetical protein
MKINLQFKENLCSEHNNNNNNNEVIERRTKADIY